MHKYSIVILCLDCNGNGLRSTVNSIRSRCDAVDFFSVVGENATASQTSDLSRHCEVYKGGKTITSLIHCGVEKSKTDWNFIVMSGALLKQSMLRKYFYFTKDDKDILFPVIDRKIWFDEGSINGIYFNKKVIIEVGKFNDEENLTWAKLAWADEAIRKGYKFKAIVGAKLF